MKKISIGINGLGRIGRLVLRSIAGHPMIDGIVVNDLSSIEDIVYLLNHDSSHSVLTKFEKEGQATIRTGTKTITVCSIPSITQLPWMHHAIDIVIDCTGRATTRDEAQKHIVSGAKKVIVSAPCDSSVPTLVYGVNHTSYDGSQGNIVSNASCTTNCIAPIAKVLSQKYGINEALMTTVHSATASQTVVDVYNTRNRRLGRSVFNNIIPTTTGAAKAVALCLPELEGKITGTSLRVPCSNVSLVDLTVKLTKSVTFDTLCNTLKDASTGDMSGVLGYTEEAVVSQDFASSTYSSIFDKTASLSLNDNFFKLIAWYDNESGYASRIVDMVEYISKYV